MVNGYALLGGVAAFTGGAIIADNQQRKFRRRLESRITQMGQILNRAKAQYEAPGTPGYIEGGLWDRVTEIYSTLAPERINEGFDRARAQVEAAVDAQRRRVLEEQFQADSVVDQQSASSGLYNSTVALNAQRENAALASVRMAGVNQNLGQALSEVERGRTGALTQSQNLLANFIFGAAAEANSIDRTYANFIMGVDDKSFDTSIGDSLGALHGQLMQSFGGGGGGFGGGGGGSFNIEGIAGAIGGLGGGGGGGGGG